MIREQDENQGQDERQNSGENHEIQRSVSAVEKVCFFLWVSSFVVIGNGAPGSLRNDESSLLVNQVVYLQMSLFKTHSLIRLNEYLVVVNPGQREQKTEHPNGQDSESCPGPNGALTEALLWVANGRVSETKERESTHTLSQQ